MQGDFRGRHSVVLAAYGASRADFRRRLAHIRAGIRWGYPICCVLRYAFSWHRRPQALERGIRRTSQGQYVPCCVFHRPELTFSEWDRQVATSRQVHYTVVDHDRKD
jgi:hypothetical protein